MKSNMLKLVLLFVFTFFMFAKSATVDEYGGYSFQIAIEPSTPEPTNVKDYIEKLQAALTAFSIQLYRSTNEYFFVRNVDVLFPSSWTVAVSTESTVQSFAAADIRLGSATAPFVENSNPCGLPGSFIDLPLSFLDRSQPHGFGDTSKALVNLWARLRWGVWEEHGDVHSSKFPYFYKNNTAWVPTSCHAQTLEGQKTDKTGQSCGNDEDAYPSEDCRFRSSSSQTATTSLMSFHFVETVTEFCDDATHNRLAPNRQNAFCGYQSIWSVIRKTGDFENAKFRVGNLPAVTMNRLIARTKPALYVLFDRGAFTANADAQIIIANIIRRLPDFFEDTDLAETMLGIGSFPSDSATETIKTLMPWKRIGENLDEIIEVIAPIDVSSIHGDFASAVQNAAIEIGKLNDLGGSALLVIKTGSGTGHFGSSIHEEDVLFTLKKNRVAVFSAEFENSDDTSFPNHLKSLAENTNGKHFALKTAKGTNVVLDELFLTVKATLSGSVPSSRDNLMYRRRITPTVQTHVPLIQDVTNVRIYLTLPSIATPGTITVGGVSQSFTSHEEWMETVDIAKRTTHSINLADSVTLPGELVIVYTCSEGDSSCLNSVGTLIVIGTPASGTEEVVVSVWTTAADNFVDFSKPLSDLAPFAIYAKVEKGGKPVAGLIVTAEVTDADQKSVFVNLIDDGLGYPDIATSDGIYSANFIPSVDGAYHISVQVQAPEAPTSKVTALVGSGTGRLLPVDQDEIGDRETVELDKRFSAVFDLAEDVVFSGVTSFIKLGQPNKILDLVASISENDGEDMRLTFSSPGLLGAVGKATKYTIQGARILDTLVSGSPEIRDLWIVTTVAEPGTKEIVRVSNPLGVHNLVYFQVLAFNENAVGSENEKASIIVQVTGMHQDEDTTTTTTEASTADTPDPVTVTKDPVTGTPDPVTECTGDGCTEKPVDRSTTPGDEGEEENKPFFETAGGIVVIIVIVLIVLGAAGGGYWYYRKRQQSTYRRETV